MVDGWMGFWRTIPMQCLASYRTDVDWSYKSRGDRYVFAASSCNSIHGCLWHHVCIDPVCPDRTSVYTRPSSLYRNHWWSVRTDLTEIHIVAVYKLDFCQASTALTKCPVSSSTGQQVQYTYCGESCLEVYS